VIDNNACENATVIQVWLVLFPSVYFHKIEFTRRNSLLFLNFCSEILDSNLPFFIYSIRLFVLQVDSVNKHGILLDVVQVISDMNLVIKKAYISSDGVWFMDGNFLS